MIVNADNIGGKVCNAVLNHQNAAWGGNGRTTAASKRAISFQFGWDERNGWIAAIYLAVLSALGKSLG